MYFFQCILLFFCPPQALLEGQPLECTTYVKTDVAKAKYCRYQTTEPCRILFYFFFFFFCKRFTNTENLKTQNAHSWLANRYRKSPGCRRCRRGVSGVCYLEASLFFSLRDRALATAGRSLTGPMPSMAAFSFSSCSPMLWSFWGFGVKSLASVLRALRRPFLPVQKEDEMTSKQSEKAFKSSLIHCCCP